MAILFPKNYDSWRAMLMLAWEILSAVGVWVRMLLAAQKRWVSNVVENEFD